jgi:hypothetical protein
VTIRQPNIAALVVAATILLPQAIVAAISPWISVTRQERVKRSHRPELRDTPARLWMSACTDGLPFTSV